METIKIVTGKLEWMKSSEEIDCESHGTAWICELDATCKYRLKQL